MRLADRHGRPLSQVMSEYPAWELGYWASWMRRVPTGDNRVEWQLACFRSQWMSANLKKGHKPPSPQELLLPDWFQNQADIATKKAAKRDIDLMVSEFAKSGTAVQYPEPETENDYIGNESR